VQDIYQLSDTDPTGFTMEITADTGLELASGVAFSHDGQLIAVSVSAGCWVYALDLKEKTIKLLVKFRTDFHEEDSSQTCARFVGNSTILTGGEDGVVRVWRLSRDPSAREKKVGTAKALAVPEERNMHAKVVVDESPKLGDSVINESSMITLTREYRGHTKRIRDIDVDLSHRNLVASSSEDQTCHLWRLTEMTPICKFSKDDALDIAMQRLPMKPVVGPRKHLFRCVRFANSGRRVFTVLTPARGDSILIKWKPETIAQESEEQWSWVVEKAAIAGDKPVASLCVSQDDRFVCTAAVTGEVKVYLASTLQQYKKTSTEQHTFAITGMSCAPPADKQEPVFHLVTGGADKNLLRHEILLEGGVVKSAVEIVVGGVKSLVGATVGLGLNLWMAATLLFILLLFIHAKTAMLLDGPLAGFLVRIFLLGFVVDFIVRLIWMLVPWPYRTWHRSASIRRMVW
jgi:WD40 repeat protein